MNTTYPSRTQSGGSQRWLGRELGRLLLNWSMVAAVIVPIGYLFSLTQVLPRETVAILITAFSLLGMSLAGFCLWALIVGMPTVRHTFYGPVPMWLRQRRHKAAAPWFDQNGTMLWQRDGRGGWVRKMDASPGLARSASNEPNGSYQ